MMIQTRIASVLLVFTAAATTVLADDPPQLSRREVRILKADTLNALGSGDDETARALIEAYIASEPTDGIMIYRAAALASRQGRLEDADALLLDAIKAGFHDFSYMRRDRDLDAIRERPTYRAMQSARDSADPLLVERRLAELRGDLGDDAAFYTQHECEAHGLHLLTPFSGEDHARLLELIERQVHGLETSLFAGALKHDVVIAILRPEHADEVLLDRHIKGKYLHSARRLISRGAGRALRHELFHAWHHADMDRRGQDHALWVQEGLASLYEAWLEDDDGAIAFIPDDRSDLVTRMLSRGELKSWSELFSLTDGDFHRDPARHYAQTRSIFEFIADHGLLTAWYTHYVDSFAADRSGALAMERLTGFSLEQSEALWKRWLIERRRAKSQTATLMRPFDIRIPDKPVEVAVAAVAPPPVKIDPVRIEIRHHNEKARAAYSEGRYNDAARAFERSLELDESMADVRYELGLALIRAGRIDDAAAQQIVLARYDQSLASLLENLVRE